LAGGTTDVAVFSLADIVASRSITHRGDEMDDAVSTTEQHYSLSVGNPDSRTDQNEIGSAAPLDQELTAEVRGRDTLEVAAKGYRHQRRNPRGAVRPVGAILACIKSVIEQCDPELVAGPGRSKGSAPRGVARCCAGWTSTCRKLNVPVRVDQTP